MCQLPIFQITSARTRILPLVLSLFLPLVGAAVDATSNMDVCNTQDSCDHKSHALLQIAATSVKGRGVQTFDTPDMLEDSLVTSNIQAWARDYGAGLKVAVERARKFKTYAATDDEEAAINYLRIRATKPKVMWECSPAKGYSSIFILSAIADNDEWWPFAFIRFGTRRKCIEERERD